MVRHVTRLRDAASSPTRRRQSAILGSHFEEELPEEAWILIEADLVFLDPDNGPDKAEQVDAAIGELSQFHARLNYYAQGVDLTGALALDSVPLPTRRRVQVWLEAAATRLLDS